MHLYKIIYMGGQVSHLRVVMPNVNWDHGAAMLNLDLVMVSVITMPQDALKVYIQHISTIYQLILMSAPSLLPFWPKPQLLGPVVSQLSQIQQILVRKPFHFHLRPQKSRVETQMPWPTNGCSQFPEEAQRQSQENLKYCAHRKWSSLHLLHWPALCCSLKQQ